MTNLLSEAPKSVGRRIPVLLVAITLSVLPALAADRHVLLDANGNGQLNDCPNPAHNAKGTSNTDELQWCTGGTATKKIIGTVAGTTTASACTAGGGTAVALTNGVQVDIDRDGTAESVYGHPQACVYNMAKSDSCDVHAGRYRAAGARCTSHCGDFSQSNNEPLGTCRDFNCWFASVLAWGFGPNLNGTGYGTASNPGYLRGAVMNGSTDSWDPNGDKNPADGAYSPIISGDLNGNGGFDQTSCTESTCTGDAYHALIVGCGGPAGWKSKLNCPTDALAPGEQWVKLDSDANGTFDLDIDARTLAPVPSPNGPRNVDHFIVKDIEFTGYNQGAGASGSGADNARRWGANINLNGDGQADGLKLDHIYFHGNSYGAEGSVLKEINNAGISDMQNSGCLGYTEIKNSFLEQNNRLLFEDEGTPAPALGCSFSIHDNRIYVNVSGHSTQPPALGFWKSFDYHPNDGRPKSVRFYNNEVIIKQLSTVSNTNARFLVFENVGNSGQRGLGELWFYGNVFRNISTTTNSFQSFFPTSCSSQTDPWRAGDSWRVYYFNNTWDGWSSSKTVDLEGMCRSGSSSAGELFVDRNNVQVWTLSEQATDSAATIRLGNNLAADASRCSGTSRYFDCGSDPLIHGGLTYYRPFAAGGLTGAGSCDPDGDGVVGFDWDGDRVNDVTWKDIAGNNVSCPSLTTKIDVGAIQRGSAPPVTDPPSTVERLRRTDIP